MYHTKALHFSTNSLLIGLFLQKKQTPLHLASQHGQLGAVSLLLELGASLDATDDYGQKPIHLAAQSNKPEVVKLLLKKRPNLVSIATKVIQKKSRKCIKIRENTFKKHQKTIKLSSCCSKIWSPMQQR